MAAATQAQLDKAPSLTLPPYPDRFYAAAQYAAIAGTCEIKPNFKHAGRFSDASSLLLYSLYQQAVFGPCNTQKPWAWNVVESAKWESWNSLGDMSSVEAMRLFVRYLEQEDPEWWDIANEDYANSAEPITISPTPQPLDPTLQTLEEIRSLPNGNTKEEEDDYFINRPISDFFTSLSQKNSWISVQIDGKKPTPRYQHSSVIVDNKLFVIGGNFNGRYLNDVQVLNLSTLKWNRVETENSSLFPPCAGHSLILKDDKTIWVVAGLSREKNDKLSIREFDVAKKSWSIPKLRGHFPSVRGGQSVDIIKNNLYVFGGEDLKRKLMNDLFMLDIENLVWEKIETKGTPPSPRSDHVSAVYSNRFLLIFGGGSQAMCYNDLHVLDIENLTWYQPEVRGTIPSPRAGHSGVLIGKNWFVLGGGDNTGGIPDTMVLELDTMTWSTVNHLSDKNSIACEGLSVALGKSSGNPLLISFGGYNGRYSNDSYVFQPNLTELGKLVITPEPNSTLPVSTQPGPVSLSQKNINVLIHSVTVEEDKKREEELARLAKDKWRNLAKSSKELDLAEQLTETEEALARAEAIALNARADAQMVAGKAKADAWATIAQAQMEMETLTNKLAAANKAKQAAEDEAQEAIALKVNAQAAMAGLEAEAASLRKELSQMREKYQEMESTVEKVTQNAELSTLKKDYAAAKRSLVDAEQELQSTRAALASEQARCFRLEVEVAELRQRLQGMEALEHEVELLRRQQAAADEAAAEAEAAAATRGTPGVWGWLGR